MRALIAFLTVFLLATCICLAADPSATAQEHTYTNPKVDYSVDFPSATWKLVGEPDDVHQHAEFVYGDRNDGYLRIRREALEEGLTIKEFAVRDQGTRFLPGFVDGKDEPFAGRLSGVTRSYEFTQAGKAMAGRTYYLQGDGRSAYVLRFTGLREKLARIRNQTDFIARSLRLK